MFTSCEEKAAVHRSLESQLPLRGASRFQVSRLDLLTLTMPKFVPPHKIVLPHNRLVPDNVVFHVTTHILLSSLLRHQNLNKIATRPIHYETESETTHVEMSCIFSFAISRHNRMSRVPCNQRVRICGRQFPLTMDCNELLRLGWNY